MKTGVFLNYIGLGSNLLHLSYCHQLAKKYGPVTIITLCKNLRMVLEDDPLIENVIFIDNFELMPLAYKISDIIVSSSIEPEAFGRVSVEAQAMKKPIIASKFEPKPL